MDYCAPGRARAVHEDTKGHAPGRSRHDAPRPERDWPPIRAASGGRATPTADELHHPMGVGQAGLASRQRTIGEPRALPGVPRQLHRHSMAISDQQLELLSAGVTGEVGEEVHPFRPAPIMAIGPTTRFRRAVNAPGKLASERVEHFSTGTFGLSLTPTRSVDSPDGAALPDPPAAASTNAMAITAAQLPSVVANRAVTDQSYAGGWPRVRHLAGAAGHPGYTSKMGLYPTRSSLPRRETPKSQDAALDCHEEGPPR